jgi:hypothetical protein
MKRYSLRGENYLTDDNYYRYIKGFNNSAYMANSDRDKIIWVAKFISLISSAY